MEEFDKKSLTVLPLSGRVSKTKIEDIAVNLKEIPKISDDKAYDKIKITAKAIIKAKSEDRPIVIGYGAHLIKNGLAPALRWMVENGYATHLATNGAGSIHDWEFAFQGESEEDVRGYIQQGRFGIWDETGRYLNLALIIGASQGKGYGESICDMVQSDKIVIPNLVEIKDRLISQLQNNTPKENFTGLVNLWQQAREVWQRYGIKSGEIEVKHPFKQYSVQDCAFRENSRYKAIYTVHPGIGYDIINTHPLCSGAGIGMTGYTDFLRFAETMKHLEGGVLLSIGSAVAIPMIAEKAISMARNVEIPKGNKITNFLMGVDDIQDAGDWVFGREQDPPKNSPAYYLRFAKTFDRIGAKDMYYIQMDNKSFLLNLIGCLKEMD